MKILSIDVGIKNLAFCLLYKPETNAEFSISKWDVINLTEINPLKCDFIEKNVMCNKPAKFQKNGSCYCLKHSKKQKFQIPSNEQKSAFINKQKLSKLHEIANAYNIQYETKIKKTELTALINDHIQGVYFNTIECKNANKIDLFNIGLNIKNIFDTLFKDEQIIDHVIIENQIGPLAARMKTIQGMLAQYFVMTPHLKVYNIENVSSTNKLKDLNNDKKHIVEKNVYSGRKKLGIAKCLELLTTDYRFNQHLDYFNGHKKKDDLADSFLQGLWFINQNNFDCYV